MAKRKPTGFGMKYVILLLLSFGRLHGYSLITILKELGIPGITPSPGSVYPTLKKLEEEGLVSVEKAGRRVYYRLTEKGKGYVKAEIELMMGVLDLLKELHERALKKLSASKEPNDGLEEVESIVNELISRLGNILRKIEETRNKYFSK
ncbi:MAG: hypothetical protein DRN30_01615 [Thermoplasmata archaeon]|nr:PadR family transcriptional regulator [Euryarchaeota archaeon]RLF66729.1 MAG: hypothetical protein DRN30_01615 [Thermoplasmata archaeon]